METRFRSERLARLAGSHRALVKKFGAERAKVIERRIADIDAAKNLADLGMVLGLGFHGLRGKREGQYAVKAGGPLRLILTANPSPVPQDPSGRKELEMVTAVVVEEIVDYH